MARPLNPAQLLPLLRTLADGRWHSGEVLARAAGITRAALSKRVQRLGEWGLPVETQPGVGCRLSAPLDLLEEDTIRGALRPDLRARLRLAVLPATDSTNTRLLAAPAADDPQALLAEHQTGGRGRRGRSWHSPFGQNLYLSLARSFPAWPPQLTALPLAVGVACAEALTALGVPGLRLKWPNDLWCGDAKLGGILIEQRGEAGGACRVVVGVGLNVSMRSATRAEIGQDWTSLAAVLTGPVSRNALAAALLTQLLDALDRFATDGFAPFAPRWAALDLTRDRAVRIERPEGAAEGVARGVDESGALLLEGTSGTERILGGDVSLRVAA